MERKAPIALIAPYEKLRDLALAARERYAVPIAIHQGDLQEGVAAARQALREGASIIISRGGTAGLISQELGIRVVEIRISGYDVLRSALDFVGSAQAVAVIGFADVIRAVQPICELLKIPAIFFRIESEADMPEVMREIGRRGLRRVIGGAISAQTAAANALDVRLIETGQEAIHESFNEALAIYGNIRDQVKKNNQLETLVFAVDESVVLIDGQNAVLLSNLGSLQRAGFTYEGQLRLADLGQDIVHLAEKSVDRRGVATEDIVKIAGQDHFVTIHRLSDRDAASEGAVIVIRDISKIRSIDRSIRRQQNQKSLAGKRTFADIVHEDPAMDRCVTLAKCYAQTDSAVVLYGETGTGKELFAQGIHHHSRRSQGPFVAVNCGAIPPTLIESELFGYVEGAFTGAHRGGRTGPFELAHNGTIFLDEINELELSMQTRLLRVLQEKEIMRIGDNTRIPVAVRVIVASNVPLQDEVAKGRFRRDLLYRLNVLRLEIPPLRRRPRDIRLLFFHVLDAFCHRAGRQRPIVDDRVLDWLEQHAWPGNVRELQNFTERYFLWSTEMNEDAGPFLEEMLLMDISPRSDDADAPSPSGTGRRNDSLYEGSLRDIERRVVRAVLAEEGDNVSRAAQRLGIDRNTLRRKAQPAVAPRPERQKA